MNSEIQSGKEILTEFFSDLEKDDSLDKDTVDEVLKLFQAGKLTVKSITNALSQLREDQDSDKD